MERQATCIIEQFHDDGTPRYKVTASGSDLTKAARIVRQLADTAEESARETNLLAVADVQQPDFRR